MRYILFYLKNTLIYILAFLPFFAGWRLLRGRSLRKSGRPTNARHEVGICLFSLLALLVFSQTVLSEISITSQGIVLLGNPDHNGLNLVLFDVFRLLKVETLERGNYRFLLINVIGNIAVFLPFGFFVSLLWRKPSVWKALLVGFCSSFFIELCQYPLNRGTDIDDLWLNTLGAFLGWALYLVFRRFVDENKYKVAQSVDACIT